MKNLVYRFIVITVKRKCALNYLSSHWPLRSGVTLFPCLVKFVEYLLQDPLERNDYEFK